MAEIVGPVREPDEVLDPIRPCATCDDEGGCGDGCCECPDCGQL